MIRTIIPKQYWKILQLFYTNSNSYLHLRDIARKINLGESATSMHLNFLEKENILQSHKEANLKKYNIKKQVISEIFALFDNERLDTLPILRKNVIKFYINQLKVKPIFLILFGSTAKGIYKNESDVDLISVFNNKTDTKEAVKYAQAQTGIKISEFQLSYSQFIKELKLKQDNVIQSGIETGYPVYNQIYFHEVKINE